MKIHWGFGIMTWLLLVSGDLYFNLIFILIGAILPDADHRNTLQGKIIPLWLIFRHRGFIHSLPAMLLFGLITACFFGAHNGLGLMIGFFSHLFLDAMTPSGIRWLGRRKARR